MGTRSVTTVFDEYNKPLVSLYAQHDGYFDGIGDELAAFLKGFNVVNGFGFNTPEKSANGMGCLAAQLIQHFKNGIGGHYIVPNSQAEEYNYEVRLHKATGRVSLVGRGHGEFKEFVLYPEPPKVLRTVIFVYDKRDGQQAKWREVQVTKEDGSYIEGVEDGSFKRFLKSRILDGKILEVQK